MFDIGSLRRNRRQRYGAGAMVVAVVLGGVLAVDAAQAQDKQGVCYITTKTGYPGDQAPAGDIAKWMGAGARAAGLPAELPVMAGLVESGLRNLSTSDSDAVGFFGMRLGIWNRGEYLGYATTPELQLKWFIDYAIMFKQQRFAAGVTNLLDDPNSWGDWVADIDRAPEQLRGRYQLRLEEARQLLAAK
ncbi:MAG: hypothetical protein ABI912_01990 [Actinomycetota bacterium]